MWAAHAQRLMSSVFAPRKRPLRAWPHDAAVAIPRSGDGTIRPSPSPFTAARRRGRGGVMGESVSLVSRRSATWMSNDEIAQARRLAEHALSRARTTADQRQKLLWLEIADTWAARAAA